MKYIDARTQDGLKQGVMEYLNLSTGGLIQLFVSVYEDTEREPWECVEDFLSEHIVDMLIYIRYSKRMPTSCLLMIKIRTKIF